VSQVEGPTSLTTVELFSCHEIFKVLVVYLDFYLVGCSFEEVSLLFQSSDDSKYLLVMDLVVLFD